MSNLKGVLQQMVDSGAFRKILLNPTSQFGREGRTYLGAQLLPERLVPNNFYTEYDIKYRTVVANDASRYSPAQKKGNEIVGSMDVKLTEQDIASEFTSELFDQFIAIDQFNSLSENTGNPTMVGEVGVSDWFQNHIVFPLQEKIEKMRWEAIVDATVPLRGDNGFSQDIPLSNPSGHRVAVADDWTDPAYNPLDDLFDMMNDAAAKGYVISRFFAGRPVLYTLLRNPNVQTQIRGYISVNGMGALVGNAGYASREALNSFLVSEGLPSIELYDLQYRYQAPNPEAEVANATTQHFLRRDVLVGVCETGRNPTIDLGDNERLPMRDTLGYVGVGRSAGQGAPGRVTNMEVFTNKPPRAEFEGWQTSFPVVTDPEAIYVRNNIETFAGIV